MISPARSLLGTTLRLEIIAPYLAAIILFWVVRIYYWNLIIEEPFSDMAQYVWIGTKVAANFDFSVDNFWQSYKLPGVPLAMGAVFRLAGGPDLWAFRIFQSLMVCLALLWFVFEVYARTRSHVIGVLIIVAVALSQPSIFWSYKPATEGLSEACLFFSVAAWMAYLRRSDLVYASLAGFTVIVAVLTRANYIPLLLIVPAGIFYSAWRNAETRRARLVGGFACVAVIVVVWLPWIIRSYSIYGHIVPLSTQGPYTFLWEAGHVSRDNGQGGVDTKNVTELQREAPGRFDNDYSASSYAQGFVMSWIRAHWAEYPRIWLARMSAQVTDRSESLTKVSRAQLFGGWLDSVLLDKTPVLLFGGLAGYLVVGFRTCGHFFVIPLLLVLVAAFGALFLSYARMLDPLIALTIAGNALLVWEGARLLQGRGRRIRSTQAPIG
jgi:hypothetical protein